jgi:hypothetical protein
LRALGGRAAGITSNPTWWKWRSVVITVFSLNSRMTAMLVQSVNERSLSRYFELPLDDDAAIDDVVTDGESLEVDCKVVGLLEQIQKRRVSFGKVDAELMPLVDVRDIGF